MFDFDWSIVLLKRAPTKFLLLAISRIKREFVWQRDSTNAHFREMVTPLLIQIDLINPILDFEQGWHMFTISMGFELKCLKVKVK